MKKIIFSLIILSFLLPACSDDKDDAPPLSGDAIPVDVQVYPRYFKNSIYPSYIYQAPFYPLTSLNEEILSTSLFKISIVSPQKDALLTIKMNESEINESSENRYITPSKGSVLDIRPPVLWKYDALRECRTTENITLSWDILINGEFIKKYSKTFSCHSINQCVFGIQFGADEKPQGVQTDQQGYYLLNDMYAGYIEEENPYIDTFLKKALSTKYLPFGILGYQYDNAYLKEQVWVFWYLLQLRGTSYSSISDITGNTLLVQNVRFFSEMYNSAQGNCVDASCFFASLLQRIGITTYLIVTPNHMFLGFDDVSGNLIYFLETTVIGNVKLGNIESDDEKEEASRKNFEIALKSGSNKYNQYKDQFSKGSGYEILSVHNMRKRIPSINYGGDIKERRQLLLSEQQK